MCIGLRSITRFILSLKIDFLRAFTFLAYLKFSFYSVHISFRRVEKNDFENGYPKVEKKNLQMTMKPFRFHVTNALEFLRDNIL